MKFVKPRKATEILGVNICTLVRWEQDSQINAIKIPSGQIRYDIDSYIQSKAETFKISSIKYKAVYNLFGLEIFSIPLSQLYFRSNI